MSYAAVGLKLYVPHSAVSTVFKAKAKMLQGIIIFAPVHTKVIRKQDDLIADTEKMSNV